MNGNRNVTATFIVTLDTIVATAGSNGSIAPSGVVVVNEGASQAFTITPVPGYHVADVLVDGISVGPVTGHTFTNVTARHTIDASFEQNPVDSVTTLLQAGWNMLSVPLLPANRLKTALFPSAASPAFAYDGSYQIRDTLGYGEGYWMKFPAPAANKITGTAIALDTIIVRSGWNFIGSAGHPVATSAMSQIPSGIVTSHFFGYASSYFVTDTLFPGRAYWVKTNSDGSLHPGGAVPAMTSKSAPKSGTMNTPQLNELSFSPLVAGVPDGSAERSIFFGTGEPAAEDRGGVQRALFDLPPVPPAGGFDARFATQRSVELLEPPGLSRSELPVLLQPNGDLRVSWNMHQHSFLKYMLVEKADGKVVRKQVLAATGSEIVRVGEGKEFAITAERIPERYALGQNYPNPFNPATVIGFDLPVKSIISLRVFSVLGQEVAAPIDNRVMDEGKEEIRFDASGLASGTYFYRISAVSATDASTSFVQIRKMLLLK
jgi:hypothetical protein